jgi:dihydrofolate reductase
MINLIWAMDENNLIGKGDLIPWHIKEDLVYFKSKVKGKTVLMGDTTYFSLKSYYKTRPLPYGKIFVASLDNNLKLEDATVINDITKFLEEIDEELWVCGGSTIYKLSLPYADNLYISFIKGEYEGDRYFPSINYNEYNLKWEEDTERVRFTLYERR